MRDPTHAPQCRAWLCIYFAVQIVLSDQAGNAQYPALNLCPRALRWRKFGVQESRKAAIAVSAGEPGGDTIGVMLVAGAVSWRKLRLHSDG